MAREKETRTEALIRRAKDHRLAAPLLVVAIILGAGATIILQVDDVRRRFWPSASPTAAITCSPEVVPLNLTQGESLYALQLHPKWKNNLVEALGRRGPDGTPSIWPLITGQHVAYRCEVSHDASVSMFVVQMAFAVRFRAASAAQSDRIAEVALPTPIQPMKSVAVHIFDDTGWNPEVTLPAEITARLGASNETLTVPVRYAGRDGRPSILRGFGSPPN